MQFLIKKSSKIFPALFFFFNFWSSKPWIRIRIHKTALLYVFSVSRLTSGFQKRFQARIIVYSFPEMENKFHRKAYRIIINSYSLLSVPFNRRHYMEAILAGLAGNPRLIHCTILAVSRIYFQFQDIFPQVSLRIVS
jgi:hypothetical protein